MLVGETGEGQSGLRGGAGHGSEVDVRGEVLRPRLG